MIPEAVDRDARVRPASARRTPSSSAASPPRRCAAGSRTPRRRSSSPPTAATGAGAPCRAEAGRRRGASAGDAERREGARGPAHRPGRRRGPTAATSGGTTPSRRRPTEHEPRAVRRRAPAVHPLHLGHDREAEGHPAHHRRLPDPGAPTRTATSSTCTPETDVFWCTADIGWVTGHSYIVYGPLANGATQVMYEGTPDTPHQGRWWEIIQKYGVTILYTAPTAIRTFMKWGDGHPGEVRPVVAAAARLGRRADQPRGVDLVPPGHRRRPHPDRRHLVADRDRRDHDQPAAGRHRDQAGLGAWCRCRASPPTSSTTTGTPVPNGGGGYLVLTEPWPSMLRGIWGDPRALQGDLLVAVPRPATSPATARRRTTTATSGCSAASTTS